MKKEVIASTTHVDRDGDKMTLDALVGNIEQIRSHFIPVMVEHDPRIPPLGRIDSACIEFLDDGEYALKTTLEIFDEETLLQPSEKREMILEYNNILPGKIQIDYDRSYKTQKGKIDDIVKIVGGKCSLHLRKSMDPISILTIVGVFAVSQISSGFFKKIGSDVYDMLKNIIKNRQNKNKENILQFKIIDLQQKIIVEINITNPDKHNMDIFYKKIVPKLDNIVLNDLSGHTDIRKVVYEYYNSNFKLLFFIGKDCIPILPKGK